MIRSIAILLALATVLPAGEALACGGVFCNQQAPVVQSGERILFLQQPDGRLVTYVQIQYQGQSQNFSWVVPVKGTPTVEAGSDVTFSALEQKTAPVYTVNQPSCPTGPVSYADKVSSPGGCAGGNAVNADGSAYYSPSYPGVDVLSSGAAGPYTFAILAASDPRELFDWLVVNNYTLTDQGKKLLGLYVDAEHHFLAVKLAPDRTVGDLRPLVIRSDEPEPCIPLRLTAVAALNNMPIEAFIVGAKRAVPDNYAHVVLNDARIDYRSSGSNYQALLSEAVDQAPGGEAFVTEYAGSTTMMHGAIWPDGGYPVDDLPSLDQSAYFSRVFSMNIPTTASYLTWLQTYQYAAPFDAHAATAALVSDVLAPMQAAQAMLDSSPYLTRLTTTISPSEMLDDPTFTSTSEMGDVSNVHVATDPAECYASDSGSTYVLADGRTLKYGTNAGSGATGWEAGPAGLTVQRFDPSGKAHSLEDHASEVPQTVRIGDGGGGCRTAAATGGAMAWIGAALGGLALLRRRR